MNFEEYQKEARTTCAYVQKIIYPTLGLCGEAGEVAEKIKKMLRDDNGILTQERKESIIFEIGDTLWYIANLCEDLNIKMEDVAIANLQKLKSRKERNLIKGDGDNR